MGCVMNWDKQLGIILDVNLGLEECCCHILHLWAWNGAFLRQHLDFVKFHESNFPELDSFHQVSVFFSFPVSYFTAKQKSLFQNQDSVTSSTSSN